MRRIARFQSALLLGVVVSACGGNVVVDPTSEPPTDYGCSASCSLAPSGTQGALLATNIETDLALSGLGAFILAGNYAGQSGLFLTRWGLFMMNADYALIASSTQLAVLGVPAAGTSVDQLAPIVFPRDIEFVGFEFAQHGDVEIVQENGNRMVVGHLAIAAAPPCGDIACVEGKYWFARPDSVRLATEGYSIVSGALEQDP